MFRRQISCEGFRKLIDTQAQCDQRLSFANYARKLAMMSTVSPVLFAEFLSPVEVKRWCVTNTLVFQRNRFLLDVMEECFKREKDGVETPPISKDTAEKTKNLRPKSREAERKETQDDHDIEAELAHNRTMDEHERQMLEHEEQEDLWAQDAALDYELEQICPFAELYAPDPHPWSYLEAEDDCWGI